MQFNQFKKINFKLWNGYLKSISEYMKKYRIKGLLFPNIILFTETENHYIVELLGATKTYNGLVTKNHKEKSALKYLNQFHYLEENEEGQKGLFHLDGKNIGIKNILMSRDMDLKKIEHRFKFHDIYTKIGGMETNDINQPLISFSNNFGSVFIDDCVLVNRFEEIYRVKHINHLRIIDKKMLKEDYEKELFYNFIQLYSNKSYLNTNDIFAVRYFEEDSMADVILSGQFMNTYLIPNIRETTIGEFINQNPLFLTSALSCSSFLYEHPFDWLEGNSDPEEKNIRPDLMLKRISDGFYDICDLKLPKTNEKKLAKGAHKRRTFVSYVDEGLSQLANYEEYFTFEANKKYAKDKYGVEVEEPILYLIVGNYENIKPEEIREASRKLKSNFRIIDYDTLNSLFINKIKIKESL